MNLFISSDMFYLEILVEASGGIKDVKIHHEGKVRGLFIIILYNQETYVTNPIGN